jgi:hypothetical protein
MVDPTNQIKKWLRVNVNNRKQWTAIKDHNFDGLPRYMRTALGPSLGLGPNVLYLTDGLYIATSHNDVRQRGVYCLFPIETNQSLGTYEAATTPRITQATYTEQQSQRTVDVQHEYNRYTWFVTDDNQTTCLAPYRILDALQPPFVDSEELGTVLAMIRQPGVGSWANVFARQQGPDVYYLSCRPIAAHTELLICFDQVQGTARHAPRLVVEYQISRERTLLPSTPPTDFVQYSAPVSVPRKRKSSLSVRVLPAPVLPAPVLPAPVPAAPVPAVSVPAVSVPTVAVPTVSVPAVRAVPARVIPWDQLMSTYYSDYQDTVVMRQADLVFLNNFWSSRAYEPEVIAMRLELCFRVLDQVPTPQALTPLHIAAVVTALCQQFLRVTNVPNLIQRGKRASLTYVLVDSMSDNIAARFTYLGSMTSIDVSRSLLAGNNHLITMVSGYPVTGFKQRLVLQLAHEVIHLVQFICDCRDRDHGEDYKRFATSLFGFTEATYDSCEVHDLSQDDEDAALPYDDLGTGVRVKPEPVS